MSAQTASLTTTIWAPCCPSITSCCTKVQWCMACVLVLCCTAHFCHGKMNIKQGCSHAVSLLLTAAAFNVHSLDMLQPAVSSCPGLCCTFTTVSHCYLCHPSLADAINVAPIAWLQAYVR